MHIFETSDVRKKNNIHIYMYLNKEQSRFSPKCLTVLVVKHLHDVSGPQCALAIQDVVLCLSVSWLLREIGMKPGILPPVCADDAYKTVTVTRYLSLDICQRQYNLDISLEIC